MIYQCYKCNKLFNENEGAMVLEEQLTGVGPVIIEHHAKFLVFKCKNCIGKKGRETIEKNNLLQCKDCGNLIKQPEDIQNPESFRCERCSFILQAKRREKRLKKARKL